MVKVKGFVALVLVLLLAFFSACSAPSASALTESSSFEKEDFSEKEQKMRELFQEHQEEMEHIANSLLPYTLDGGHIQYRSGLLEYLPKGSPCETMSGTELNQLLDGFCGDCGGEITQISMSQQWYNVDGGVCLFSDSLRDENGEFYCGVYLLYCVDCNEDAIAQQEFFALEQLAPQWYLYLSFFV